MREPIVDKMLDNCCHYAVNVVVIDVVAGGGCCLLLVACGFVDC